MKKPKDDEKSENSGNPGKSITPELCKAYREILEEKIEGVRSTIKIGLTIATLTITTVLTIVQYYLMTAS